MQTTSSQSLAAPVWGEGNPNTRMPSRSESEQVPRRPAFAGAKLCSAPNVVAFLSELTSSQTGISV